jgi:hypothetical protein
MSVGTVSGEGGREGGREGGKEGRREGGREGVRQAGRQAYTHTHTHTHTHAGVKIEGGDASWRKEDANTSLDTLRATVSGLRVFIMCS